MRDDLARPPASAVATPPDIVPATWQAIIADLQPRKPVTAMAVLLVGVTGARRDELCGLRWSDVDHERSRLTIVRFIRHDVDKKLLIVAPTKSGRERRVKSVSAADR